MSSSQFAPETATFETIDLNDSAVPKSCGLCNTNPSVFAYCFGEFANGARTGYCCTPCACRALMEMAERNAGRRV
jgi:hypothetical protein